MSTTITTTNVPVQVTLRSTSGKYYDLTRLLTTATISTDVHGYAAARFETPLSFTQIAELYQLNGLLQLTISNGADTLWDGRAEDFGFDEDGEATKLSLSGFGWQSAYDDGLYTALWSDSGYSRWQQGQSYGAPQYQLDARARIWIALVKNTAYAGSSGAYGYWQYPIPINSTRTLVRFRADYAVLMPTNFQVQVTAQGTGGGAIWTLTPTNALQTGSIDVTIATAAPSVQLEAFIPGATGYTETGETGTHYVRLLNVRVQTISAATLTGKAIIQDLATYANALNPAVIPAPITTYIGDPGFDLRDQLYEDTRPSTILNQIVNLGGGDGTAWSWAVWEDRQLRVQSQVSAARTWYVDLTELNLERLFRSIYNRVRATYNKNQLAPGPDNYSEPLGTARTDPQNDTTSQTRYGAIREQVTKAGGVPQAQAITQAQTSLADTKDPAPRARIAFDVLWTAEGARVPLYKCRGGDYIVVRNIPPTSQILTQTKYRVISTEYDLLSGKLTVDLETPPPTLDWMLARSKYQS